MGKNRFREDALKYWDIQQALEERKKAKGLECRNSAVDPTPGNMFIQFVPKKATADTCRDLLPDKWEKKQ